MSFDEGSPYPLFFSWFLCVSFCGVFASSGAGIIFCFVIRASVALPFRYGCRSSHTGSIRSFQWMVVKRLCVCRGEGGFRVFPCTRSLPLNPHSLKLIIGSTLHFSRHVGRLRFFFFPCDFYLVVSVRSIFGRLGFLLLEESPPPRFLFAWEASIFSLVILLLLFYFCSFGVPSAGGELRSDFVADGLVEMVLKGGVELDGYDCPDF